MTEPWFDPNVYAWIPGTAVGVVGGTVGALVGMCAPRGILKPLVYGLHFALIGVCCILLVLGVIALASGQPYGIWYGLGLPGLIGVVVCGSLTPVIRKRYIEAELRKSMADDL